MLKDDSVRFNKEYFTLFKQSATVYMETCYY